MTFRVQKDLIDSLSVHFEVFIAYVVYLGVAQKWKARQRRLLQESQSTRSVIGRRIAAYETNPAGDHVGM